MRTFQPFFLCFRASVPLRSIQRFCYGVIVGALAYGIPSVYGTNYTWSAGANGSWDTNTNWTPTGIPNASTDEAILIDATGRIISVSSSKNLGRIQFSGGGTWDINGFSFNAFGINTGGDFEFISMTGDTTAFINNDIVFQNSPLTFNIASGSMLSLSGILSGSHSLKLKGGGEMRLYGANLFTGGITIDTGTLTINSDAALGTSTNAITLTNNGQLMSLSGSPTLGSSRSITLGTGGGALGSRPGSTLTVNSVISGSNNLTINKANTGGIGTVVLGATNTFTGNISIEEGTLSISSDAALGNAANDLTINVGSTLSTTSTFTLNSGRNLTLGGVSSSGSLNVASATALTIAGNISGASSYQFNKQGAGTLVLTGTNTGFTGNYGIQGGILSIASATNLGNPGAVILNGNTLQTTGTLSYGGLLWLSSGGTLDVTTGTSTFSNVTGNTLLTKTGAGTLAFTGTNSGTFNYAINQGTLSVSGDAQLGNAANDLTFATGTTFQTTGATTMGAGRAITLSSGTVTFDIGAATSIAGVISGTGALTKIGAGTLTLSGTNTFSGSPITVSAGTLSVATNANLGNANNDLTFAAGTTLQTTGATTMTSGRAITLSNGTITFNIGANTSIAGLISGTGTFTKTGAGTLTLTGNNSFSGGIITINQGTLDVNSNSRLGNVGNDLIFAAGTTLQTGGILTMGSGRDLTLSSGNITFNSQGTMTIQGIISGAGSFTKAGTGVLTLSGTNTFSGSPITVSAGRLIVSSDANLGNAANDLSFTSGTLETTGVTNMGSGRSISLNSGITTFDTGADTSIAGTISGSGALNKTGIGTLSLTGTNTFGVSLISINAGILSVNSDAALGHSNNDIFLASGTTLQTTGATAMAGGRQITLNAGTVTIDAGGATSIAGAVSGAGGLIKTGASTLTLTTSNSYTGTTTVSAGTLILNSNTSNAIAAGAGAITLNTGGTLDLAQSNQIGDNVNLILNGGTLSFSGTATGESLGTLSLTENSIIDFGGTDMILTFSGIGSFAAGKTLTILNWGGLSGGDGLDQLRFTDGSGLTPAVKSQIYFASWGPAENYPVGINELTPSPEPATLLGGFSLLALALGFEYRRRLKGQIA